jgi:hypothetical protein
MSSASELPVVPGHFRQGYIVYTAFVVPSCEESKDLKRDYAKHEQLTVSPLYHLFNGRFPDRALACVLLSSTAIKSPARHQLATRQVLIETSFLCLGRLFLGRFFFLGDCVHRTMPSNLFACGVSFNVPTEAIYLRRQLEDSPLKQRRGSALKTLQMHLKSSSPKTSRSQDSVHSKIQGSRP